MHRPRILLVNQFFQPEPNELRGSKFVEGLIERGFDIEVLTGFPNYPAGEIYEGYRLRPYAKDHEQGSFLVHRVAHFVSHDSNGLRRGLSYLSLMLSSIAFLLVKGRRYDVLWVQQGPATLALAALVSKKVWRRQRFVLDAQDLWPDSVTSTGMLPSKFPVGVIEKLSCLGARGADAVVTLSSGAAERLVELGVEASRISVVYNWASEPSIDTEAYTRAAEILDVASPDFRAVYVGGFGVLQDLSVVVEAAQILQKTHPGVGIVLAGDGVEFESLSKLIKSSNLPNISLAGRVPADIGAALTQLADVTIMHLRETPLSHTAIPSKIGAYMHSGSPGVVAAEGAVAQLAKQSGAFETVPSQNPKALADAIGAISLMSPAKRKSMGKNAQRFYQDNMGWDSGITLLSDLLNDVCDRD